jgi:dTDP-glucose 4,6-dehydratase
MNDTIFVTGGAGFIGANFIREWLAQSTDTAIVNIDALTYAGNLQSLADVASDRRYIFEHKDICDSAGIQALFLQHRPRAVVHFAAESHVDRSISSPDVFVRTNVTGTFTLLEAAREYWQGCDQKHRDRFRFVHVSTDEVYGSLGMSDPPFCETTPYSPNSPYSASKAASDHFVRSYFHTYGLPTLTTNCSNNYGPLHFPEKLIPLMILNAIEQQPLPIYGDGKNVRDWLHVHDHCAAIRLVLHRGVPGHTYNVGGANERTNLQVVETICDVLDGLRQAGAPHRSLIKFVRDRPGHDLRYAIDSTKLRRELGWAPKFDFESGLLSTVRWYLENPQWVQGVRSGAYREWILKHYEAAD